MCSIKCITARLKYERQKFEKYPAYLLKVSSKFYFDIYFDIYYKIKIVRYYKNI